MLAYCLDLHHPAGQILYVFERLAHGDLCSAKRQIVICLTLLILARPDIGFRFAYLGSERVPRGIEIDGTVSARLNHDQPLRAIGDCNVSCQDDLQSLHGTWMHHCSETVGIGFSLCSSRSDIVITASVEAHVGWLLKPRQPGSSRLSQCAQWVA